MQTIVWCFLWNIIFKTKLLLHIAHQGRRSREQYVSDWDCLSRFKATFYQQINELWQSGTSSYADGMRMRLFGWRRLLWETCTERKKLEFHRKHSMQISVKEDIQKSCMMGLDKHKFHIISHCYLKCWEAPSVNHSETTRIPLEEHSMFFFFW
jgi:hypothetical protein